MRTGVCGLRSLMASLPFHVQDICHIKLLFLLPTLVFPPPLTVSAVLFPSDFVFRLSVIVLPSETRASCPQSDVSQ